MILALVEAGKNIRIVTEYKSITILLMFRTSFYRTDK